MNMYNEILAEIITKEWTMFTTTKSVNNKRASCQDDMSTFVNARRAQWSAYPLHILQSYLQDLDKAIENHRNIVTEKYAYMMADTDYENFKKIKHLLPAISTEKKQLINKIINIMLSAEESLRSSNPELVDNNRPLYNRTYNNNVPLQTSVETYTTGELSTYSTKTLRKILEFINSNPYDKVLKKQLQSLQTGKDLHNKKKSHNTLPKLKLDLDFADKLIDTGIKYAKSINKNFVICICDKNGTIIALKKMDNALIASVEIAAAKAITASHFKTDSINLQNSPDLYPELEQWNKAFPHGYCFMGGGVLIYDKNNNEEIIGAIGVSGGSIKEDISVGKHILSSI